MALHHLKKKKFKALVDQGLTADELREQMTAEEVAPDDIDDFIDEAYAEETPGNGQQGEQDSSQQPNKPERKSSQKKKSLSFDADVLAGNEFKAAEEYLAGLPLNELRDFEVYKVEPIITERYPGLPDTPKDMTGIKKKLTAPLQKTRISPRMAMEMNSQVRNTGRYYFITEK